MSARLEVRLQKRLPGFALDVEWSAGDGVAVLFGPSGAGKSLTLQCLAGLMRPDAGRVVVDGRVLFDSEAGVDVAAAEAPRRLRLPGLRAVPAPDRRRQCRLRPARPAARRAAAARGRGAGPARASTALARAPSGRALGRPASARGARPRARHRSRAAPARRAAVGPRPAACAAPSATSCAAILADWGTAAVRGDPRLHRGLSPRRPHRGLRGGTRDPGRARAPSSCWQPASQAVARVMGLRQCPRRAPCSRPRPIASSSAGAGQTLEAVNSPSRSYLPAPDSTLGFFIRPEYVRLIRKDRGLADSRTT